MRRKAVEGGSRWVRMRVGCLTVAAVVSAGARGQGQDPVGAALIVGQVVDADSGRGVAESVVTLSLDAAPGAGPVSPAGRDASSRKVITDGSGRFVFAGLAKGRYNLTALKPGHTSGSYGKLAPRGRGAQIDLVEGERLTDIRVLVWKHAAITGRVVDEAGEPVVGAGVTILRRALLAGRPGFSDVVTVSTDDRGMYRAGALEPGTYVVGVPSMSTTLPTAMIEEFVKASGPARSEMQQALFTAAPTMTGVGGPGHEQIGPYLLQVQGRMPLPPRRSGETLAIYPTVYHPVASSPADSTAITLRAGEVRPAVDLVLRAVPAVRVSGRLEGPAGAVGTAPLHLVSVDPPSGLGGPGATIATTVAEASGAFTFYGVPAGSYELRVLKLPRTEGGTVQSVEVRVQGAAAARGVVGERAGPPPQSTLWAKQALAVGPTDVADVIVTLQPGFRMSGKLEFEGGVPGIPPERFQPLLETRDAWVVDVSEMTVAAGGSFTSYEAPPGLYRFTVPTPSGWFVKSVTIGGREHPDLPFELKDHLTDIVVTISNRGARISGAVRDASSAPDRSAAVILFPVDSRQWVDFSAYARGIKDARSGRDGSFTIGDLPAGEYFIVAVPQPRVDWSQPGFLESLSRVATRVTLGEAETRAVDLRTTQVK